MVTCAINQTGRGGQGQRETQAAHEPPGGKDGETKLLSETCKSHEGADQPKLAAGLSPSVPSYRLKVSSPSATLGNSSPPLCDTGSGVTNRSQLKISPLWFPEAPGRTGAEAVKLWSPPDQMLWITSAHGNPWTTQAHSSESPNLLHWMSSALHWQPAQIAAKNRLGIPKNSPCTTTMQLHALAFVMTPPDVQGGQGKH